MDEEKRAYWESARDRRRAWLPSDEFVTAEIDANGFWEDHYEWRISTLTDVRIEPADKWGRKWFHVIVTTDQQAECWCPTVHRALEYAGVLAAMHMDTFYALGWPSWESKSTP